jgi:hypothetical protein
MRGAVVSVFAVLLFMSAAGWLVIGGAGGSRVFVSLGLAVAAVVLLVVDSALRKKRAQSLGGGQG